MFPETVSTWIGQYGYFGIFSSLVLGIVGFPIPDELLLILSGYMIFKDVLAWGPTLLAAILGTFCGIIASYGIGRMSEKCLHRVDPRGRFQARLLAVRGFFERFGRWALIFGYLIPGLRNVTGFSAGAAKLKLGSFAPYALAGAAFSSVICVTFGYAFGPQAEWIFLSLQRNLLYALAGAAGIWLIRRRMRPSPQAKAVAD